jgi:hypothetical protein
MGRWDGETIVETALKFSFVCPIALNSGIN